MDRLASCSASPISSKAAVEQPAASGAGAVTSAPTAGAKTWLVRELLRPYTGSLVIILVAMLVETAMSLAAPWPLKIILDNVVGTHKAPEWLHALRIIPLDGDKLELAAVAGMLVLAIAALNAAASYVENYYTESVSQYVAHDLRMRVYDHLQRGARGC